MSLRETIARTILGKDLTGLFVNYKPEQAHDLLAGIFPGAVGAIPPRTITQFLKAYSASPWLRSVEHKIAHSVAMSPIKLYAGKEPDKVGRPGKFIERKDWRGLDNARKIAAIKQAVEQDEAKEITSHLMLDVLSSCNPFFHGLETRTLTQIYLDLNGENFWMKGRNGFGAIVQLWPIPPPWIISTPTPSKRSYRVSFRGWNDEIPDTEIIWMKHADPANPYARGTGIAQALGDELDTDEYTSKFLKSRFLNNAMPPFIVSPEGDSDGAKPEFRRLEQSWLKKSQGFWRAFVPFFSTRPLKVQTLSDNFREMELTKLRTFERDACYQTYGVPPEILGVLNSSNRATIDAADYLYSRWVLCPRLDFLVACLQTQLAPEYDPRLLVAYDSPVAEDDEFSLKTMTANPAAYTIDQWLEMAGLPPDPVNGSYRLVSSSVRAVDDFESIVAAVPVVPTPGDPLPADPADPAAIGDGTEGNPDAPKPGDEPSKTARKVMRLVRSKSDTSGIRHIADRMEPKSRAKFLKALAGLKGKIDPELLEHALKTGTLSDALDAMNLDTLGEQLGPAVDSLVSAFQAAGVSSAADVARALSVDFSFTIKNPKAGEWAASQSSKLITAITDDTRAIVRDVIQASVSGGWTTKDAAKAITELVGLDAPRAKAVMKFRANLEAQNVDADKIESRTAKYAAAKLKDRADTIARTEVIASSNAGQHEAWSQAEEAGLIDADQTMRTWIVTDDDRLCADICEPLDGAEAALDEPFDTDDGAVMYPPAHPNCRCDVGLVFNK